MFVITNLETLGAPLAMTMFSWNKQETVQYMSLMHGGFGFVGFVMYAISVFYDFGKVLDHRIGVSIGLFALVLFHMLTFPWWGLPGSTPYQQEYIIVNGTKILNPDPVGCKTSFDWCAYTPPINPILFVVAYVFMGTMQGVLLLSGSVARMLGPIFVA
ncbi:unnamed protein product [Cylicostephanus goldi]|uniref:Uncharacterized protein n=1 Tax=Cylicostephanus goldi TaxID=71465 RepID=A0A3P6R1T4_CYLGO|nr:unnamed protein product [Cylicostephanus goldi]